MKKILSLLLIVMIFAVPVSSQEETQLTKAGTTPDSLFYFLDTAMEKISLAMTFNANTKAEKRLEIAEERLSEVKEMALKGEIKAMTKAEEGHKKLLMKVQEKIEMSDDSEMKSELEMKFQSHNERISEVKNELKIKIEFEGEITEEQQVLVDSIMANIENQAGEIEIKIKNKRGESEIEIEYESEDEMDDDSEEGRDDDMFEVDTKIFVLEGVNYAFFMDGEEMPELKVDKGDTVRIEFTSSQGFHDFVIDEFNVATERVSDGGSTFVEFVADTEGIFEYYCSVGQHRANGMKGNLIVE
jgi:plastocyanin